MHISLWKISLWKTEPGYGFGSAILELWLSMDTKWSEDIRVFPTIGRTHGTPKELHQNAVKMLRLSGKLYWDDEQKS